MPGTIISSWRENKAHRRSKGTNDLPVRRESYGRCQVLGKVLGEKKKGRERLLPGVGNGERDLPAFIWQGRESYMASRASLLPVPFSPDLTANTLHRCTLTWVSWVAECGWHQWLCVPSDPVCLWPVPPASRRVQQRRARV